MAARAVNQSVPNKAIAQALISGPAHPKAQWTLSKERLLPVLNKTDHSDPDADLLARYAAGDSAAAADLLDSLSGRLFSLGMRMLNDTNEAEDIVQETMIKVWKIAPDWRHGEAKVASWAYGVARNMCLDRLRKRRTTPLEDAPEQIDTAPLPLESMIAQDRADALQMALEKLPERQRQAVVLRHLEDASNPEIAEVIGTSVEAVESLLARGKRKLAQLLSPLKERI